MTPFGPLAGHDTRLEGPGYDRAAAARVRLVSSSTA